MKKIITLIAVALLMASCGTELYPPTDYELSDDGKTLIEWLNKNTEHIDMQGDKNLRNVTEIGHLAFTNHTNIESIILPKNLEVIKAPKVGDPDNTGAFSRCLNLASIEIPEGVKDIPKYAFLGCRSLASVTIPKSVTSIGNCSFMFCDLTNVVINSPTPPRLVPNLLNFYNSFDNSPNLMIYVPSGSEQQYTEDEGWSKYSDRIRAK